MCPTTTALPTHPLSHPPATRNSTRVQQQTLLGLLAIGTHSHQQENNKLKCIQAYMGTRADKGMQQSAENMYVQGVAATKQPC